jgi:hypothetical protein
MHDIKRAFKLFFGWDGWPMTVNGAKSDPNGWVTLHQGQRGPPLDEQSMVFLFEGFVSQMIKEKFLEPETVF